MNDSEAQKFLNRINYNRDGWENLLFVFERQSINDWMVITKAHMRALDGIRTTVFRVPIFPCRLRGQQIPHAPTPESLMQAVLLGVFFLEEHEVLERINYNGARAFEAHDENGDAHSLYMISSSFVERQIAGYGPKLEKHVFE